MIVIGELFKVILCFGVLTDKDIEKTSAERALRRSKEKGTRSKYKNCVYVKLNKVCETNLPSFLKRIDSVKSA